MQTSFDSTGAIAGPPAIERPGLGGLAREGWEACFRFFSESTGRSLAGTVDGGGRPVLGIPGFLASDHSMRGLYAALGANNFSAHGWLQGRNFGLTEETMPKLIERLDALHVQSGRRVALVGWSIGGVIARELAKCRPDMVERVVTLGSPFSGDLRTIRIWRIYEWVAGHKVDEPPYACATHEKPPVKTIALWSRLDGVIPPTLARGGKGEADRTIEIDSAHIRMTSDRSALRATLHALTER
jgi:pimeloyl-ACP methyl ester carboxylesterase